MKINVTENRIEKYIRLPHLGQRIIKTALAVFLCLIIYMLRGFDGLVVQSTVAAIICIQPHRSDSMRTSLNRIIGTLLGAAWGLMFLWLMRFFSHHGINIPMIWIYLIMAFGIIATLYTTVILKKTEAASLSAIVFICIVAAYPDLEAPVSQTLDRIIDTSTGILVAGLVNAFHLPRVKHSEYLFFIRLQDLVPDRYSHVSSNILVMLHRLYDDGARICLVSKWAPAFLLSQMGIMNISLPIIVMDGAAMYDIPNKQYLNLIPISMADAYFLCNIFRGMNLGYCIYAVRDSSLMIYRRGNCSWAEEQEYELMKRSPYRNYLDGDFAPEDQIAFIRLIDINCKIDELEKRFRELIPENRYRMVRRPQPKMEGYSGLYFYHPEAVVENQKKELIKKLEKHKMEKVIPVDMVMQETYTSDNEAIALLNKTRNIFEPIWKPWKQKAGKHLQGVMYHETKQ